MKLLELEYNPLVSNTSVGRQWLRGYLWSTYGSMPNSWILGVIFSPEWQIGSTHRWTFIIPKDFEVNINYTVSHSITSKDSFFFPSPVKKKFHLSAQRNHHFRSWIWKKHNKSLHWPRWRSQLRSLVLLRRWNHDQLPIQFFSIISSYSALDCLCHFLAFRVAELRRPNTDEVLDCKSNGPRQGCKDVCAVAGMEGCFCSARIYSWIWSARWTGS